MTLHLLARQPLLLLLLLGLLLPAPALAAPGDAAPGEMDEDDEEEEEDEEEEGPKGKDLDLPEIEKFETAEPEASPETPQEGEASAEEEADLDERYRVAGPDEAEPAAAKPASAKATDEDLDVDEAPAKRRGLVKVIQKKFFLKYRRLEVTPHVGYVGNDHFISRFAVGASLTYHINDLLSVEAVVTYMPDLGETDYKSLTKRFRDEDEVVPDISRVTLLAVGNVGLSPIYGKVELGTLRVINYDIYLAAGFGVAMTKDDTAIIQSPCDVYPSAADRKAHPEDGCHYVDQAHFVTNVGGGLRIVFNDFIGVRLDGRQFTHIEQVYRDGDIGLEMKQNFLISLGVSFFLPPSARNLTQ